MLTLFSKFGHNKASLSNGRISTKVQLTKGNQKYFLHQHIITYGLRSNTFSLNYSPSETHCNVQNHLL